VSQVVVVLVVAVVVAVVFLVLVVVVVVCDSHSAPYKVYTTKANIFSLC
jgi:hypothetical protein